MPFFLIFIIIFVIYLRTCLYKKETTFEKIYKDEVKNIDTSKAFPKDFLIEKRLIDFNFINSEKKSINMFIETLNNNYKNKIVKPNEDFSNTYLKEIYGVNNLDILSHYENNYYEYIYTLNSLGKVLIDEGLYNEAIKVLDEAIYCKSNISNTYNLYFNAMKKLNNNYTLNDLLKNDNIKNILIKNKYIIKKLEKLN